MDSEISQRDLLSERQLSQLKERKDFINILSVTSNWLQIAIAMSVFYLFPSLITFLIGVIVVGSRQFALAVLMHEAAHNLLFKDKKVNDFISQWFCAYPIFSDTKPYRPYHLAHHRFTETSQDPDLVLSSPFPITKASFMRKMFRDLTGLTGLRRYSIAFSSIFKTEGDTKKEKITLIVKKLRGFVITNMIIFILVSSILHWSIFFLLWWLPAFTYYSLIVRIRNIAEHAVTPGGHDLNNTRTTKASWILRYLMVPHHVNYHLEHHLFTRCPWYNLPKAHLMLKENGFSDKMCVENSYFSVLKKATSG